MIDIIPVPGVLTDLEHPSWPDGSGGVDMHTLVARGYEWISFQLTNGATNTGVNIDTFGRASGFKDVGGWGVVYDQVDFFNFGKRFALALLAAGADHAIVDAEMCAKGTRIGQKCKPIIDGMRAGGWNGPVHLCPLGAPVNAVPHGGNDFGVDTKSFTDTGGGLLPQAYFNAYAEYRPDLVVDYWLACGVPRDRINVMIELAVEADSAKHIKITGSEWVTLLKDAGVKPHGGFSVYMVQHATPGDWAGLDALSVPAILPPVAVDPVAVNRQVSDLADTWLNTFLPEQKDLSRLRLVKRIATATDPKWNSVRQDVKDAIDGTAATKRAELEVKVADLTGQLDAANAKIAAARDALD